MFSLAAALTSAIGDTRPDRAVATIVSLWRALWSAAKWDSRHTFENGIGRLSRAGVQTRLLKELSGRCWIPEETRSQIADALLGPFAKNDASEAIFLNIAHFCLFDLVKQMLSDAGRSCDLEYWASRDVRYTARLQLSAPAMRSVQIYTKSLKRWLEGVDAPHRAHHAMYLVAADLEASEPDDENGEALSPDGYFDLIAALGWVWPSTGAGEVQADPARFDAEELIGRYFGLPTAIPGLDAIFAGSGPLVIDAPGIVAGDSAKPAQPIGGRVLVITGPYGSGKSTLVLELAVEVARKGGAAIVAAMEQSPEECLYALESFGIRTSSQTFQTVREMRAAIPLFSQAYTGKGVLAFLPITRSPEAMKDSESFGEFLTLLSERFTWMEAFPLRLIIVDPINSVLARSEELQPDGRRKLLDVFDRAKQRGINICLTRERAGDIDRDPPFEENIADTVLHVATARTDSALRRSIEVRKSRLQKEEPGRHDLSMRQGAGIRIFPSSASVARRANRAETPRQTRIPVSTGIDGLDRLLGRTGLLSGDIVALNGPPGSSRTLIGEHFLFVHQGVGESQKTAPKSLFVSDASYATILYQLQLVSAQRWNRPHYGRKNLEDIVICSVVADSVEPSQILQTIKDQFEHAKSENTHIDRVLVADISRWERHHGGEHGDPTFGHALMALLRSYGATCALLADYVTGDQTSLLRDVIVNGADCVLQFERMEFRGQVRQFVRATRSREMTHRRDLYEMIVAQGAVNVRSAGVLLRRDEKGNVRPVNIRLFLHADSPHHHEFNAKLEGAIQTSLADVRIDDQWSHYDPDMFRLSASSAVDEVQVMQLDEFQLPMGSDPDVEQKLFVYRPDQPDDFATDPGKLLTRLGRRIVTRDGTGLIAVPFYENISVLARHDQRMNEAAAKLGLTVPEFDALSSSSPDQAWLRLVEMGRKWEEQGKDYWFFSCPFSQPETVETYNCLFFEILLAFVQPNNSECGLATWLAAPEAKMAANIFRSLCCASHAHEREYFRSLKPSNNSHKKSHKLRLFTSEFDSNKNGPVVWRHWYNTLSEMMWDLEPVERSAISVHPLPGCKTSAGEWYLSVPAYSAAPELAWEIIHMITSPERELQRIYHGVGLPTRESYYRHTAPLNPASLISPFFHVSRSLLKTLVEDAFQRSQFPCYQRMTETISAHLQQILELPAPDQHSSKALEAQVNSVIDHLLESIDYIRESTVCSHCHQTSFDGVQLQHGLPREAETKVPVRGRTG